MTGYSSESEDVTLRRCVLAGGVLALCLIGYVTNYRLTFGERDAYRVFVAVIDAFQTNKPLSNELVYGYGISRGYFALVELLRPWGQYPERIAMALNALNAVSALVAALSLYVLCRQWAGRWSGVFAVISLMSVPIWFHGASYAHPMWPAMALFLAALAAQATAWAQGGRPWQTALAILLLAGAFSCRLDIVLMAPMYLGLAVENGRLAPARIGKLLLYGALGLGLALIPYGLYPSPARPEGTPFDQLRGWHNPERFVRFFGFSQARIMRGIGPAIIAAYLMSVAVLLKRKDLVALLLSVPTVAVNYLFWIPNAQPERHFLYMIPAMALSIGVAVGHILADPARPRSGGRLAAAMAAASICLLVLYTVLPWPGLVYLAALPPFMILAFAILEPRFGARLSRGVTVVSSACILGALVVLPQHFLFKNYYSVRDPVVLASLADRLLSLPPHEKPVLVIADSLPLLARMQTEKKGPLGQMV